MRQIPIQREGGGEPSGWTRARLIEPATTGFIVIAASAGRWWSPRALPSIRRRVCLADMRATAAALATDPDVVRADVFRALLRPPGTRRVPGQSVPAADFDAVLLIETTSPSTARELLHGTMLTNLLDALRTRARRVMSFAASNDRRIGPVDHDRQGIFLFNYFSADDVETNLAAWQYTAGWFQDETRLDNSTVLVPVEPRSVDYSIVNHCRWDRLRDVLPSLLFQRTFRSFVLRVFAENRVAPRPILYKIDQPPAPPTGQGVGMAAQPSQAQTPGSVTRQLPGG